MSSAHMARRSPRSPVAVVCEKYQSDCMCNENLRSRLDLPTKFSDKCQGVDDRLDNKTQTVDPDKTSLKWLMKEEMPSEQQTNKKIDTANMIHLQSNSKLVDNLPVNHGKASKNCQRSCHVPGHGRKGVEDTDHHQPSHQNFVDISLSKLNRSASRKAFCNEVHPKNSRSIFGCKSINCVDYDQQKKINVQRVQMNEAEETSNQKSIQGKYLSRDGANHQSKQLLDALDILNSNKELFIELLQDPDSLLVKHLQDLKNSQAKGQQTISSSGANLSEHWTSNARQCEEPNSLKSCDRYLPKESGDSQPSDTIVVLSPGPISIQKSSERINPYFSQKYPYSLRTKGQSVRPKLFSFGHIKRKLKDAWGVNKNEQQWTSINGKLEKSSYDCQGSQGGDKGIGIQIVGRNFPSNVLDIGGIPTSSLEVKKTDKIKKAKDFELNRHEIAATSEDSCRNSKFSLVGCPMEHESGLSAMPWKHHSEMIHNGNEDVDLLGKPVPKASVRMFSFPEHGLLPVVNPGWERELGFATRQMRFSPYGHYQAVNENRSKFQKEKKNSCLSSLKQNIEALPSADTERQTDQLQVFKTKQNISESHLADMKVKEDDLRPMGETNPLGMASESHSTHQVGHNQSTDAANKCEKNGYLESSRLHSSSDNKPLKFISEVSSSNPSGVQKVADSKSLKDNPERNIHKPAELLVQALQTMVEDHYAAAQERLPLGPKIKTTITMDKHVSFSEYISAVLRASGLNWDELSMKCHSTEQLLDRSLFDEMKMSNNQFCGDLSLLFDCINEVLVEGCQYSFGCSSWLSCIKPIIHPLPVEKSVIHEVIKRVDWYLLSQPPPQTFQQLAEQDLARSTTWLDIRNETEVIAIETVEGVLEELLMEIVFELYI
ncbi:uncharacterized protein LOC132173295 isoform X2 [Corylus avellana]|uniref:uncharacterized protein LOC132173295 isoform X2 n=1 Tax=Corylus avellana TaxID=13451 RepID=UPI00286B5CF8|nr:uncharacterized protein LOC132173295 isoform X2 [Corylus avellana]